MAVSDMALGSGRHIISASLMPVAVEVALNVASVSAVAAALTLLFAILRVLVCAGTKAETKDDRHTSRRRRPESRNLIVRVMCTRSLQLLL